jgi:hypothetical protein
LAKNPLGFGGISDPGAGGAFMDAAPSLESSGDQKFKKLKNPILEYVGTTS